MSATLKELYHQVTLAISQAEQAVGGHASVRAHLRLSEIEEQIAELTPASSPEGAIARRGAVRAAVAARAFARADDLVTRYDQEPMSDEQRRRIRALRPVVVTSMEVERSLARVLDESRRRCLAEQPCPALQDVGAAIRGLAAAWGEGTEWVVLADNHAAVPEAWTNGAKPAVVTFEDYAERLAGVAQDGGGVCEPNCVAVPEVRERLAAWLNELRDNRDLVVITPD